MCGIIGYTGSRKASLILLSGLKNLEYRGYDSCGMAVKTTLGIEVKKGIGKVDEVSKRLAFNEIGGVTGIAHTRWGTHGGITQNNSHPHLSNNKTIAVVHNGIIENYQEIKKYLVGKGFIFQSETDTEVIPNLIEDYFNQGIGFTDAVGKAIGDLKGQYAILIMSVHINGLIAVRKEAPLVLGVGDGEYYIASDIPAFIEQTKRVVYLRENDMLFVNTKGYVVMNDGEYAERSVTTIDWDAEQVQKGEHEHYFIKEVLDQIETINKLTNIDRRIIQEIARKIQAAKDTYIVACGTASYACMYGLYLFSKISHIHINFYIASEFGNFRHFLTKDSLVIAISQSGETADTLTAIRLAKEKGAEIVSITNVEGSTLARESSYTILQRAGQEICVISTKAYTSQLAILMIIAHEIAGKYNEAIETLKDLVKYLYYLTSESMRRHIEKLAKLLYKKEHIYLIGRSFQYPTALEAALKIKEVSYIHAEAYAGGELKHGSIAMIEKGTPCIVFVSRGTEAEILSNAIELKTRGGYIIGVSEKNNEVFDYFIKVRESSWLNSICQIIPMQLLAYELAILRGCDPDKPRNLAKSVTVK